jgi:hypothetical protein
MPKEYIGIGTRLVNRGWVVAQKINVDATVTILMASAFNMAGKYLRTDML